MLPSQKQPAMAYDYSPLGNQVYPGQQQQQPSKLQQQKLNNGYVYQNSPLGGTAMLNQQQQAYNNLNLSTRVQQGMNGASVTSVASAAAAYPTPRATNISPNLNFASLYSNRARLNAQKGFDLEDDMEFCPEIPQANNFTHHKFNPYTSSTFSPTVSPTSQNAHTTSPLPKKENADNMSPRGITPRAKKVLEIVNPLTGMRVGSPAPYK